jgi:hypothetical protein
MGDVQELFRRAAGWKHDAAKLDKIKADISAFSEARGAPVHDPARALLDNARRGSNSGLNEYQSVICHVYIVRGENNNHYIQIDLLPYPAG